MEQLNVPLSTHDIVPCVICADIHPSSECTLIEIKKQVFDNVVPSKALLTLPECLAVETMADQNYSVVAKTFIDNGTRFGPLEAKKTLLLDANVEFVLKIFDENGGDDLYLNTSDENVCNWMMFILPAQNIKEQNMICYQECSQIFFVTIRDINIGEHLKAWYGPYYAIKMKKTVLIKPPILIDKTENTSTDSLESHVGIEPMVLDKLVKGQQNILPRKNWTCKTCGKVEKFVPEFAKHIKKHYTERETKTICDICNKSFEKPTLYRRHFKVVHQKVYNAAIKKKKSKDLTKNNNETFIGDPFLNNLSLDNSLLVPSTDLVQLSPAVPNNLINTNIFLDVSLSDDNLLNETVKDLEQFNFEMKPKSEEFVCDICLHAFSGLNRFLQHLNKHTGKFTCQHCLKVFCRKENLVAHTCNGPRYSCQECKKQFKLGKHLIRHLDSIHNKKYNCNNCKKYYHSLTDLKQHNCSNLPDHIKPKFPCSICGKVFGMIKYMKRHLKIHNNNNKLQTKFSYVCETCGQEYTSKDGLNHHKKTHAEPLHSCDICSKGFRRMDVLKTHMSQHDTEKKSREHQCTICNLPFKNSRLLTLHKQMVHSIMPAKSYRCVKCSKTFVRKSLLNKHLSVSHIKTCPHCKKHFETEELLKIHLPLHPHVYYECPICNTRMKLRSSLTRHVKKLHPNQVDLSQIQMYAKEQNASKDEMETKQETNSNLLGFASNEENTHPNADFENYSICQSILDNFEELLNDCNSNEGITLSESGTENLEKDIQQAKHFDFSDFGIDLHNNLTDVGNTLCLSMPDISGAEQQTTLGIY